MPRRKNEDNVTNIPARNTQSAKQATQRKYERTQTGDLVHMHRSRNTGAMVAVLRGPAELGYGTSAKWIDMCLAHHTFTIFPTRVEATAEANKSDDWCSICAQQLAKKKDKSARTA